MRSHSIYLHIPFCTHRCGYCDFNTYAGLESLIPDYISALCSEIDFVASNTVEKLPVHTVFIGGGTPSLLPAPAIERILNQIERGFNLAPELEVTLEANPGTLSREFLNAIFSLGINRLSIGMQSAHPGELRLLERHHSYEDVIQSMTWARKAGFGNINLDLIFGLPEQQPGRWEKSLSLAIGLKPEHFSLYALTLEHGTPFNSWYARGLMSAPDPDQAANMYEWASEQLDQAGYIQYEISNWAMERERASDYSSGLYACAHNLQYWRNQPYLGFGAGAHGYANGIRTVNVLSPAAYIRRLEMDDSDHIDNIIQVKSTEEVERFMNSADSNTSRRFPTTPATQSVQWIDSNTEMGETMMMGLRLVREGVSSLTFKERFNRGLEEAFQEQIERWVLFGLLEWNNREHESLRLTKKGYLLGNQVFLDFI